jgi:hypothetical protein
MLAPGVEGPPPTATAAATTPAAAAVLPSSMRYRELLAVAFPISRKPLLQDVVLVPSKRTRVGAAGGWVTRGGLLRHRRLRSPP